ncbi:MULTISPECIES: glycosyltransferase family 4 protein [unclassified Polaromonas]|uniref:glycosyltransferase family 4 protein n=1 Tax=unclassified Polaromonas TaxID=2638319 RepID=UPI000F094431|nr:MULTISPECIES: glycosyltransferase family 4 protein [unclassified Polaromonas]AYQ27176.1 glycosyltransferase WbuB [Polaromonas sp. SP1]QGJ17979.1 glycosyltransferase [Polaromonas sp. Pch-P]
MRILIVSQYFWPENFIISDFVRKLAERGHEVVVATGKPNYPDGRVFPGYRAGGTVRERFMDKVDVVRVPIWPRGRGGGVNLTLNYLSFVFSGLLYFPWLLRSRSFDAIVVFAPSPITQVIPAILLKWLKRAHLAVWVQDMWPDSLAATGFVRNAGLLKAVGWLVRLIYGRCDTLLLQSRAFQAPTARYADPKKLVYFPNSVDPDVPAGVPDALPAELSSLLARKFCVVFAGNIGKAQAVETVVQAAVLLRDAPEICLVLVGSGSMLDWVQGQKNLLKLDNLALPGRFPAESMPELFREASALLVTLKSGGVLDHTVPSKIQAYLAAGRPIVAALQGEGGKVVEEAGAGMVCEPENAQALVDCMRRMHALPLSARDAMGQKGRACFDANFDMNRQVERLVEILQARRSGLKG